MPEREAALDAAAKFANERSVACPACSSRFADTWSFGEEWHCYSCRGPIRPIEDEAWCEAERRAMEAVAALDAARAPTTDQRERQHLERGVSVKWLKNDFLASLTPEQRRDMTTAQAVAQVVKPRCAERRCRFVELPEMRRFVGRSRKFISAAPGCSGAAHTPSAPVGPPPGDSHRLSV